MSSKTTNYNLHKIDLADSPPDITVINSNWDIIDENLAKDRIPVVAATSTDGIAYTATVDKLTALYVGLTIIIVPNMVSSSTSITLNVNGLGAKNVRLPLSFNTTSVALPTVATWLSANKPLQIKYDGTQWKTELYRISVDDLYGTITADNIDLSGKLPFVRSISYTSSSYTTNSSATTVSAYNLDIPAEDITSTSDIIITAALAVSTYGTSSTSETNYSSYYMRIYNSLTTLDNTTMICSRQQYSGSNNLDWTNSAQYMYTPAVFSYVIRDHSANTPIAVRIMHCPWTGAGSYIFNGTVSALVIPK